jgi:hypothetical protein
MRAISSKGVFEDDMIFEVIMKINKEGRTHHEDAKR